MLPNDNDVEQSGERDPSGENVQSVQDFQKPKSLMKLLRGAFRHIADPEYRDYAVEMLFSNLPVCWKQIEENFPTLSRIEAAQHLAGRLKDARKGTLYETILALHPGLGYCFSPDSDFTKSPEEAAKAYLASLPDEKTSSTKESSGSEL